MRMTMKAAAVAAATTLALSGCGGGKVMLQLAERAAGSAGRAAESIGATQAERALAQAAAHDAPTVRQTATRVLERWVDGLDDEEVTTVVTYACEANDIRQVGTDPAPEKVAEYVEGHLSGGYGLRSKAEGLAEDIRAAKSGVDIAQAVAVAAICEAAG
ncbi:MAG: hypothetical protein ABI083_11050 [Lapillicoccus sp.]